MLARLVIFVSVRESIVADCDTVSQTKEVPSYFKNLPVLPDSDATSVNVANDPPETVPASHLELAVLQDKNLLAARDESSTSAKSLILTVPM